MNRIIQYISVALGAILHPLWMPTYGMLLFCAAFSTQFGALPITYWLIATITTFVITALIPLIIIIIQIAQGTVSDIYMRIAKQRTTVYIYSLVCYGAWCYFLSHVLHAPITLSLIGVGATVALFCVLMINMKWKISAHASGIGGLIGGVFAYYYSTASVSPALWLIAVLLFVAWLLMCSRIYLKAHTPTQVTAGFLLGGLLTFLPPYIFALITETALP